MPTVQHPDLGTVQYTLSPVPLGGDAQTESTIDLMRHYALEDCSSPEITADAEQILNQVAGRGGLRDGGPSDLELCYAAWEWVRSRVRFNRDEKILAAFDVQTYLGEQAPMVEALIRPRDLSLYAREGGGRAIGDCDDFAMYLSSLLCALGIANSFVTVAADGQDPEQFSHVYVAAYPGGVRVALDASHGPYAGWETPRYTRRTEWPVKERFPWLYLLLAAGGVIALCKLS